MKTQEDWKKLIGKPSNENFDKSIEFIEKYECDFFDCEVYIQANGKRANGETTYQRVMKVLPKNCNKKMPAVVVPFYFPEAGMGFDPKTKTILPKFAENPTILDIVKRGYIVISADAYHLTYVDEELNRFEVASTAWTWKNAAELLNKEHPDWCGTGKLISDTILLVDALLMDERVDTDRIGIYGHSLGGKMAFYAGCFDDRIKVIVASDFGLGWDQTNWNSPWYWGDKLEIIKQEGFNNTDLLALCAPKPFCLIAGEADNEDSNKMLQAVPGYDDCPEKIFFVNHKSGHRPPKYAADAGYGFLDHYLK